MVTNASTLYFLGAESTNLTVFFTHELTTRLDLGSFIHRLLMHNTVNRNIIA